MPIPGLFDKSFLQSLSIDESVQFDHRFHAVVSPVFYAETLADLAKVSGRSGRAPEDEVRVIAEKFPEMHGSPCAFHYDIALNSLMGIQVPMNGRVPLAGGIPVMPNGHSGIVYRRSPESEAFARWNAREFQDLERMHAKQWREQLGKIDLHAYADSLKSLGIDASACKTLDAAYRISHAALYDETNKHARFKLLLSLMDVPRHLHARIFERWKLYGYQKLGVFAPYATYVAQVELFFRLGLASTQISPVRNSNRTDIAYLFYLPFCSVFISNDGLHARTAPFFMREDQMYLHGPDLKSVLKGQHERYQQLPVTEQELGLFRQPNHPHELERDGLLVEIWDKTVPNWRAWAARKGAQPPDDSAPEMPKSIERLHDAPPLDPEEVDFDLTDPDSISVERMIAQRKGSYWQLPKAMKQHNRDKSR